MLAASRTTRQINHRLRRARASRPCVVPVAGATGVTPTISVSDVDEATSLCVVCWAFSSGLRRTGPADNLTVADSADRRARDRWRGRRVSRRRHCCGWNERRPWWYDRGAAAPMQPSQARRRVDTCTPAVTPTVWAPRISFVLPAEWRHRYRRPAHAIRSAATTQVIGHFAMARFRHWAGSSTATARVRNSPLTRCLLVRCPRRLSTSGALDGGWMSAGWRLIPSRRFSNVLNDRRDDQPKSGCAGWDKSAEQYAVQLAP